MSIRVDTTSLISGAVVCGNRGLGVLGSTILADTATGDQGAGYLFNDVDGGDSGKEFRGLIVTPPSAGTFFAHEDGSFSLVAPDAAYTFVYRLYVDGVDLGTATASLTIGATSAGNATGTLAAIALTAATSSARGSASASAALAYLGLTEPTATAAGTSTGTSGNAVATTAELSINPATGSAYGSASAVGSLRSVVLVAPTSVAAVGGIFWPAPAQVLAGVQYGPTGADYTGTLTGGSGPSAADIAAAVWSYTQ